MYLSVLALLFLFFYVISQSVVADTEIELPEITVTNPTPSSLALNAGQSKNFNRTELTDINSADLSSALRGMGGVGLAQSNSVASGALIMRGAAGSLGMVNLDGVPLFNNFTSFFPLSHYPLDLLENAQINKNFGGAASSSRTLGGSINLTSRQLADQQGFLHAEGGSYGTVRSNLGQGVHTDLGNFTVAAGRTDLFEGISQASPPLNGGGQRNNFQMTNALLHWNQDFNRGNLDSSLYFVRVNEGMGGPGLLPNGKIGWQNAPNGNVTQETWVTQTHGSYLINHNWETTFRTGYTQDQQSGLVGNILGQRFPMDLTSQLWVGRWENLHKLQIGSDSIKAVNFSWGLDTQQQHADSPLNPAKVYALTNTLVSPIARLALDFDKWQISSDFRFDHYDLYGDHAVFNLNSSLQLTTDVSWWVNGGTGFRAPAVNERLHPLFGNNNLAPETNTGGESGLRWKPTANDEISLSGYVQHYRNLIALNQNANTGMMTSLNYPQAKAWGSEAQAKHQWNQNWKSGISYAYMDVRNPKTQYVIPIRPQHQGQFWTEWQITSPLKLRVDLNYRDGYFADSLNTIKIPAAARLNIKMEYQFTPKLNLYVRGENITDNRTPDLLGFNYIGAAVYGGGNFSW